MTVDSTGRANPRMAPEPVFGDVFGDRIVIKLVEREMFPPGHKQAGRLKPRKVWMRCRCGSEKKVLLSALQKGNRRCLECYQGDRSKGSVKTNKIKSADSSAAFITKMILGMGLAKR